jgi:hypothetical protein
VTQFRTRPSGLAVLDPKAAATRMLPALSARKRLTDGTIHAITPAELDGMERHAFCGEISYGRWQTTVTVPVNCPGCLGELRDRLAVAA